MILQLVKEDNEVILNCPYGEKIDYFTNRGCKFIDIRIDRRGKNLVKDFKLLMDYYRIIRRVSPDLVLAFAGKTAIYAGFVCGLLKVPCIINNAGLTEATETFRKFLDTLYWFGFHKATCMMYQNKEERDVINRIVKNKVPYREIPGSGVDLDEFYFCPYPKSDNPVIFDYVGRIVNTKGINEYLECARRIRQKHHNTVFRVFGAYDDVTYKELIQKYSDENIIEYYGVQMDMKPFIKECHAAIHPSYYEGMTNVVLEHSSMGRVCIGSNIAGVAEGIEEGKTGFLFEVKNVDSMVTAVERFLSLSNEQKAQFGYAARKKMEREFNRQIVTEIYMQEIEKISMGVKR